MAYDVWVQPLLSASDVAGVPFGSAFGTIEPGAISKGHRHHECELILVLRGTAVFEVEGTAETVEAGGAVFIPPFKRHLLRNESADADLIVASIAWAEDGSVEDGLDAVPVDLERMCVLCPPPTANGGLHLGHVAGPFLRADVYRRGVERRGGAATLICGTDDHQTYVKLAAERRGLEPKELARSCGDRIVRTLEALGIEVDHSIRSGSTRDYALQIRNRFVRLIEMSSAIRTSDVPTPYCEVCDRSLYHAYVVGDCPQCGTETAGEICEACGMPNQAAEMRNLRCSTCAEPVVVRTEPAQLLSLNAFADELRTYHSGTLKDTRLAVLIEDLLARPLSDYRLTRRGGWGISAPDMDGHVIDPFVEVMLSLDLGDAARDAKLVQFLGFDNSFFYAILFPALSFAMRDVSYEPIAFISNEFLQLEGRKFSTSQDHAIWADQALEAVDGDALRLTMLLHSPEAGASEFTQGDYEEMIEGACAQPVATWLDGYRELAKALGDVAPEPGAWTSAQIGFLKRLAETLDRCSDFLSIDQFSAQQYAVEIIELVKCASRFRHAMSHLAMAGAMKEELRTAQALDLMAAKVFATVAAPAMPGVTRRLARELGFDETPEYESMPLFVTGGTRLEFTGEAYFPKLAARNG